MTFYPPLVPGHIPPRPEVKILLMKETPGELLLFDMVFLLMKVIIIKEYSVKWERALDRKDKIVVLFAT